MAIIERALTPQEQKEISDHASRAFGTLGLTAPQGEPEAILQAVEDFVDRWQDEKRRPLKKLFSRGPSPNPTSTSLGLGFLWGNQLVRRFGWVWTRIQDNGQETFAVVSPDRAIAVYPTQFLRVCLDDPRVDCTIMLAFNMLAAGKVSGVPARSYENLMGGVHRIVPKR